MNEAQAVRSVKQAADCRRYSAARGGKGSGAPDRFYHWVNRAGLTVATCSLGHLAHRRHGCGWPARTERADALDPASQIRRPA